MKCSCQVQTCLKFFHQLLSLEQYKDKLTKKTKLTRLIKVIISMILLTNHVGAAFAQVIEAEFDGIAFVKFTLDNILLAHLLNKLYAQITNLLFR